jgi:hypothetical protein
MVKGIGSWVEWVEQKEVSVGSSCGLQVYRVGHRQQEARQGGPHIQEELGNLPEEMDLRGQRGEWGRGWMERWSGRGEGAEKRRESQVGMGQSGVLWGEEKGGRGVVDRCGKGCGAVEGL